MDPLSIEMDKLDYKDNMTAAGNIADKRKPSFTTNEEPYVYGNEETEQSNKIGTAPVADKTKLDRNDAEERWIPSNIESFHHNDVHLNTLMEPQNHRYAHQFPNDLTQVKNVN